MDSYCRDVDNAYQTVDGFPKPVDPALCRGGWHARLGPHDLGIVLHGATPERGGDRRSDPEGEAAPVSLKVGTEGHGQDQNATMSLVPMGSNC